MNFDKQNNYIEWYMKFDKQNNYIENLSMLRSEHHAAGLGDFRSWFYLANKNKYN